MFLALAGRPFLPLAPDAPAQPASVRKRPKEEETLVGLFHYTLVGDSFLTSIVGTNRLLPQRRRHTNRPSGPTAQILPFFVLLVKARDGWWLEVVRWLTREK